MANFIEIIEGFHLSETLADDGWSGTLVYMQVDAPSATMSGNLVAEASLPKTGDAWPAARDFGLTLPTNFVCREIDYGLQGGDFTENNIRTMSFSTKDESKENQPDNNTDSQSLTISALLRTITLSKAAGAEKIKDADGNVLDLITIREVRANYTVIENGFSTLAAAVASGSETGKVLTSNKNWLSLGTGVSQYEVEGSTKFKAARSYSYKKIVNPKDHIDNDTWQAEWFVKPAKFKLATANLYEEAATFVDTMPTVL